MASKVKVARRVPVTRTILLVLWILLCLFGLLDCGKPSRQRVGEGLDLRVMSFNIRYGTADDGENSWPHRRELVFRILRQHSPDVIGLQEALRFQIDEIRKALSGYGEVGVGRDDGKTRGEYAAILFREKRFRVAEQGTFWFSDTPEIPGSKHWGNQIPRICTWARFTERESERGFYLYNVHLDHISQVSREKSVYLLTKRMSERSYSAPVIVTGDFNAGEDNPAVLYIKGGDLAGEEASSVPSNPLPLVDTYQVLYPSATHTGTFNGFNGDSTGAKIDYVLVQPDVKALQAEIVHTEWDGRYPSDHFPVVARLLLPTTDAD